MGRHKKAPHRIVVLRQADEFAELAARADVAADGVDDPCRRGVWAGGQGFSVWVFNVCVCVSDNAQ